MNGNITAVIFDMDGLMFDTEPFYHYSWYEAAKVQGHQLPETFFALVQGRNNADAEAILREHTSPDFDILRFRKDWEDLWFRRGSDQGIALKKGLPEILDWLRERHMPMAVATSSNRKVLEFCLGETGLQGYFSALVSGEEIMYGKPSPDIFIEAALRLGKAPSECMVFEDSNAGAGAAIKARMPVIVVPDHQPPTAEITAGSLTVQSDLGSALNWLQQINGNLGMVRLIRLI